MKRLTISLDDTTAALLETYTQEYNLSKAELMRKSLRSFDHEEKTKRIAPKETIETYIMYLVKKEHLIVDIAHWKEIFIEIGKGSEYFWNQVYKIGENHRIEYHEKGLREVKQILEHVEKANWYTLNQESPTSYLLILAVSESQQFVKKFFEGLFSQYPKKIKIIEETKKLRIKVE